MEVLIIAAAVMIGPMVHSAIEFIFKALKPKPEAPVDDELTIARYGRIHTELQRPEFIPG